MAMKANTMIKASDLVSKEVKQGFAQAAKKTFDAATGAKPANKEVLKGTPLNMPKEKK